MSKTDDTIISPASSHSSGRIPPVVQRAVGKQLKVLLNSLQHHYGISEEDCLMVLLALTHGYAIAGGMTTDQLCQLAFNVWALHGKGSVTEK